MNKQLLIILFLASMPVFAGDPHHHESTVNNYDVNNIIETNGLAALYAATQIHHAENISGLQLGGGIAQKGDKFGFAAGAAFNVPGRAMFNGSVAKEGDETFFGLGINLSVKP